MLLNVPYMKIKSMNVSVRLGVACLQAAVSYEMNRLRPRGLISRLRKGYQSGGRGVTTDRTIRGAEDGFKEPYTIV